MSRTLSWQFLSPLHVARIQQVPAGDVAGVKAVLLEADRDSRAGYFADLSDAQAQVLADMFFHLLRFSRAQAMTPEKQSTLISIAHHTHADSMAQRLSIADSFAVLE